MRLESGTFQIDVNWANYTAAIMEANLMVFEYSRRATSRASETCFQTSAMRQGEVKGGHVGGGGRRSGV